MPSLSLNVPGLHLRVVEQVVPPPLAGIVGLVGQAERGPLNEPQLVTRWGEFLEIFGGFTSYSYLAYTVFAFFHTGGERCRVVRVAHETADYASVPLLDDTGHTVLKVRAASPGAWGQTIAMFVEPRSSSDMMLTETAFDAPAGATDVVLRSVAGMSPGDLVSLVDPRDSRRRDDRLPLLTIDRATRRVTFTRPLAGAMAAGTPVVGRGWRLRVSAPGGEGQRDEVYDQLALSRDHPRFAPRVINGDPPAREFVMRMRDGTSILVDVAEANPGATDTASRPAAAATTLVGGGDGPFALDAPYYTGRTTSGYFRPVRPGADPAERFLAQQTLFGLAGFEASGDLESVAIPDLALPDIYRDAPSAVSASGVVFTRGLPPGLAWSSLRAGQREMLDHCARMGDRLALLDAPPGAGIGTGTIAIDEWPGQIAFQDTARAAALYYPWIRHRPVDFDGVDLFMPPCGHVAGVYASTARRGVGKPPANEPLPGVVEFETDVTDAMQAVLNPRGVNCLRVMPGRGPRIWGARTLSTDPRHRCVNARRVTLLVIRQIISGLQWAVFEVHNDRLRGRIAAALTQLMTGLLRSGSLAGEQPADAFFVQCDDETTPPDAGDRGELIAKVGFTPAGTTEFIVVTIQRTPGTLAVAELEETR